MQIPFNDLKRHFQATQDLIAPAVERVMQSGWYVLGEEGARFEALFASYCGARACVGLASGTDALEFALRAVGVKAGSRVATVANAGFYASTALLMIGAIPVFVDVDCATHLIDLGDLSKVITRGVDAAVVTHLYGMLCDMDGVRRVVAPHRVPVIEDCAQAHGAVRNGRTAGALGDVAAFSFYPTKNLGAVGDGGALVTNDLEIAAKARLLRQYAWSPKYHVTMSGARNSRLDEIQAAVLTAKLPFLDCWNARRRDIATRYSQGLKNPMVKAPAVFGSDCVAHLYVIVCENRESLREHLAAAGIGTEIHFPVLDYKQVVLAGDGAWPALPVSEWLSDRILTLPCFPELTNQEVDFVIARINEWRPCIR